MQREFLPTNLEGWLAVARDIAGAGLFAGTVLWFFLRTKMEKMVQKECEERKRADHNIENKLEHHQHRVEDMAQDLHNYIGKLDILQMNIHASETARMREMAELREELRVGFARLEGAIKQQRRNNG